MVSSWRRLTSLAGPLKSSLSSRTLKGRSASDLCKSSTVVTPLSMASWTNVVAAFLSPTMIVLLYVPSSFTRFSGSKACKHELVEVNWLEGQVGVRRRLHTPGGPREQDRYRSGRVSQGVGRGICVQRQPGIVIGSSVSLRRAPDRRQARLLAPRSTRRPGRSVEPLRSPRLHSRPTCKKELPFASMY